MKHSFWHQVPIVRILFPFVIGISCDMFFPIEFYWSFIAFLCLSALSVIVHFSFKQFAHRWVFGLIMSLSVCCGGMSLHKYQNELRLPDHFSRFSTTKSAILKIQEPPVAKNTTYKLKCSVIGVINTQGEIIRAEGSLLVYWRKSNFHDQLTYGDLFAIPYQLIKPVPPPQNPDEFNYKRYLAFNNIFYQAYIDDTAFLLNQHLGNPIREYVYASQNYVKKVLRENIRSANETAVAQALLYGNDDDIDPETIQAYSNTGTLHVLAVSGMHVGIIFMILNALLKPLEKIKKGRILSGAIILISLWLYSLLCGMSPSILRATVMFTFMIVAKMLNTRSNVYNTLSASALTLLCYDTNMLANVGFQLSYLAVLGIVFFQPMIYKWYTASSFIGNEIWKITAVSLAAQLITCPIGLLYFHQFPNCFLFSNLIIIPLTTAILYLGIVLIVVSPVSALSWLLGQILFYLIQFTNQVVVWVEQIPYAYVNGIHISIFQSIILYGIIISMTAYFILHRPVYFKCALLTTTVFIILQSLHILQNSRQKRLIVYNINRVAAIQIMDGHKAILIADSALLSNKNKLKFHLQQHLWRSGIEQQQTIPTDSSWKRIMINQKKIWITGTKNLMPNDSLCDLLIVKNNIDLEHLSKRCRFNNMIITSAIPSLKAKAMMDWCLQKNISVQYAAEKGAIELSLRD